MNPAQLLEHFDRISEAPDAVARLRRFILDLAVRGKLIEPTGQTNLVSLASLCSSTSGNGKMIKGTLSAESGEGLYPCFSASGQDVWHNKFEHVGEAVIVSAVGARCGKAFLASGKWSAIANTHILFPKNETCSLAYLYLIANNEALWIRGGSAQPFVKVSATLKERLVYSPPLAEQHRIVAKVDELMVLCDQLEAAKIEREARRDRLVAASLHRIGTAPAAATEAQSATPLRDAARFHLDHLPRLTTRPEHIKQLRQTIRNLAVRGRLVPQDPNDEPVVELLKRIQVEKARLEADGFCKKSKPLPTIREDERPFDLPLRWEWARLRSIVFTLGDGLHGTPTYADGTTYYFINGNNLVDGKIVIKPNTKTVSFEEMQKHKKPMSSNTVLVSINGTLGNVAFFNNEEVVLGKSACYFNLSERIYKRFIKLVIESQYFIGYALQSATGATIKNLSLKAMNEFPVPLPSLAEQHRIVAKVDELMALCGQLEAQLTATQTNSRRLLEAVLRDALHSSAVVAG